MPRRAVKEASGKANRHYQGDWSEDGQTFYLDGKAYRVDKKGRTYCSGKDDRPKEAK